MFGSTKTKGMLCKNPTFAAHRGSLLQNVRFANLFQNSLPYLIDIFYLIEPILSLFVATEETLPSTHNFSSHIQLFL